MSPTRGPSKKRAQRGAQRPRQSKRGAPKSRVSPRATSKKHRSAPDPLSEAVGAHIRALRYERGITYDAFVGETELGRGYVSELERGLVVPSIQTLRRVADALDLTMADLVAGDSVREQLFTETRDLSERELLDLLAAVRKLRKR